MKGEKDKIEKENKKEYEAPEIEVNKFNNSGDPVEMFAEDVTDNEMNDNTQEFDKVTENTVVDNQNTNKHKKHNNKKNKKPRKRLSNKQKIAILSCSLIIVILVIVLICLYLYQSSQNNIVLANDTISIEYGEEYIPSVEDFVELTDAITLDNTYIEYKLEYKEVLDEDTGEIIETYTYPEVGEYDITVYHSFDFKLFGLTVFTSIISNEAEIVVEDTTAPVFSEDAPTEITTYLNEEITEEKLNETFGVTDYSEFTLSLDENFDIDYSTEGEYNAQVIATDEYGNQSYLQIAIKVVNYVIDVDVTEITLSVGKTEQIVASVDGSTDGLTYSSSDESIVTVDENGTITAISDGTATVTVMKEEYNISATVAVTVTSSTTTSSSSNKTSSSSSSTSSSSNKTSSSSSSTSSSKNSSTNTNTNKGSTSSNNSTTNANSSSSSFTHSECLKEGYTYFNSIEELVEYAEEMMLANDNIYGYKYYYCVHGYPYIVFYYD